MSARRTPGGGEYSEATAREIDNEVRRIIDEQYTRVKRLLADRLQELRKAAAVLLVKETITGEELQAILTNAPHQRSSMNNDQQESLVQLNSAADAEHARQESGMLGNSSQTISGN
jgi:hypothetical protein